MKTDGKKPFRAHSLIPSSPIKGLNRNTSDEDMVKFDEVEYKPEE